MASNAKRWKTVEKRRLNGGVRLDELLTAHAAGDGRLERMIRDLFKQHADFGGKRDLLMSIPGIGEITAARLLAEIPNMLDFKSAKDIAAFAGLSPQHFLSGTSVHGKARLSKTGSSALRRQLFFPAVTAMHRNPLLSVFAARLLANGKPRMLVVGAVMRKLLVLAYGVLKSGVPFDPIYSVRTVST